MARSGVAGGGRAARAGAVAVLVAVVLGCSTAAPPAPVRPATPTTGATAPTAPTAPPPFLSPLTGLPGDPESPVLAVKIDNTEQARPWDGVEDADVVYVVPVEGGLTRLLAVFSSRLPASVGPIRSVRESDVDVLRAYGRPALAYSGLAPEIIPIVDEAPVLPVTPESAPEVFSRSSGRPAPTNVYASPRELLERSGDPAAPRDVGFRFGPPPPGGEPTDQRDVGVGGTTVGLRWEPGPDRWTVAMGGSTVRFGDRDEPIAASTVVVQRVATRASAVTDAAGSVSPYAITVGDGEAEVLRDGRTYPARWSRPEPVGPTRFTTPDGAELPFAQGPVWVILAPTG